MTSACIIGVSGFGATHYCDLMAEVEAGHMRVVGATVINQDEEAEKCAHLKSLGCALFTDHSRMLARLRNRIDLCLMPTGIPLHAPMSIDAMRAGANVLVEKPVAATVQEVRAMASTERMTGRFTAVAYQTMYASETLTMKRLLADGRLGTVHTIKYWGLWPRPDSYYARNGWAGRLKTGSAWVLDSPFNNALAHQLNMVGFLAGRELYAPARLKSVQAELYRGHDIESLDTACLRVETRDGPTLYAFVTHCSERLAGPQLVARGELGTLRWTPGQAQVKYLNGAVENIPCDGPETMRSRLLASVRRRVRDPDVFVCDLRTAGTHTLIVNGAHESSAIHTIDPGRITRTPEKDSTKTVILGIDEVILQAVAEEQLFSEMNVPWARPGTVFALEDYRRFRGGQTGLRD